VAKIKLGSLISEASGSLGGHTIQHSKGGMQLRTKPIPANNPTASQRLIRSLNHQLQKGWRDLSNVQRRMWDDWAKSHAILADRTPHNPISGHSLWMKWQFTQLHDGFPLCNYLIPPVLGPELAVTWYQTAPFLFETFITSGKRIISAINTVGYGFCGTNPFFPIVVGQRYLIQINLTKYSGIIDYVCIGNFANFHVCSNTVVPVNGSSAFILTIIESGALGAFAFRCGFPVNFSVLNVSVKKFL
jgi:hypothetical protein